MWNQSGIQRGNQEIKVEFQNGNQSGIMWIQQIKE
jgi:hypothetical protein